MKPYKDLAHNSGISAYEIADESITIRFKDGEKYVYNYKKPGTTAVEEMKKLALRGKGLTTYINQHVRDNYARKIK